MKNSIKAYRKAHKITQEKLADAIGVTRQTVCAIEQGRSNVSVITAYKIASFLEADIEDIFDLHEDPDIVLKK